MFPKDGKGGQNTVLSSMSVASFPPHSVSDFRTHNEPRALQGTLGWNGKLCSGYCIAAGHFVCITFPYNGVPWYCRTLRSGPTKQAAKH
eukprot:448503-Rhodomonas_salina.1